MKLRLLKLNNSLAKGPLIEQFNGKTVMLVQNETTVVDDDIGWKILGKYPHLVEHVQRASVASVKPKADMTKNLTKYRNKMHDGKETK